MRRRNACLWVYCLLVLGLFSLPVVAQEPPSPEPAAASDDVRLLDARATERVRAMSDYLAKQKNFKFNVEIAYDVVEPDGEKTQLGRRSLVDVMRPNGLRVDAQGDRGWNQLSVYDGKYFLHFDRARNLYSRVEVPDSLDAFFDFLFKKYSVSPPLVDFLLQDVYGAMTEKARSGALLGDAFVAERACDHVAFSGEDLDWQLWIEKGDTPWPRKFVITYKDVDVRPQFMAVFRKWQTDVEFAPNQFEASPPSGATEVPLERFLDARAKSATESKDDAGHTEVDTPEGD